MDIKFHLDEMITIANKLEYLIQSENPQPMEQLDHVTIIKDNIERLQEVYPMLRQLLQDFSPYEAVRKISFEWRTPFVVIIGYSRLILEGYVGEFTEEQLKLFRQLEEIAKQIKAWSDTPHTERL